MISLKEYLSKIIIHILNNEKFEVSEAYVSQSNRPDLSDYQSNVAMVIAKKEHKNPKEIANKIASQLKNESFIENVSVDGPGFINITLTNSFLEKEEPFNFNSTKRVVLIDYGGPNIAKEMHVGHLRSAIIGESIKRIMRTCGDTVLGDVHFGDWGTPIGMLIAQLKREKPFLNYFSENICDDFSMNISDISALYRRAASNFKEDETFKEEARIATFELQRGNKGYLALWKMFKDVSVKAVKSNYDKLDVTFDLWMGESDVNEILPVLTEDLQKKGLAILSDGALIVPLKAKNNRERAPMILKKTDGAYTYAATDLATIIQRKRDFNPQNILYVVDARQKEHFEQVFEVAHLAGYVDDSISLEHIPFGTVNGDDGKPFKTRNGGVMNLKDLITLAIQKAKQNIPTGINEEEAEIQAYQIAIGALKFQDLKNGRTSDYIFDTENFTKSEGKTGAYIQYAIARINSILDKSNITEKELIAANIKITHSLERTILLLLKQQNEALQEAYIRREPSVISDYVYALSQAFSSFYSELPINSEKDEAIRLSRLKIIDRVRNVLKSNLQLLGISSPDKMAKRNKN